MRFALIYDNVVYRIVWYGIRAQEGERAGMAATEQASGRDEDASPERIAFVRSEIVEQVNDFGSRGGWNRFWGLGHSIAGALLGGATTVLIGFKSIIGGDHPSLSTAALITSALVTVLATWEAFFDSRWLWVLYVKYRDDLEILLKRFDYAIAGDRKLSTKELDGYYNEYLQILRAAYNEWREKRGHEARTMANQAGVSR
jgi:hypothetical protein